MNPRTFVRTSHGALHRPGCAQLKRVKGKTEIVVIGSDDMTWGHEHWMAQCCWRYGQTTTVEMSVWARQEVRE